MVYKAVKGNEMHYLNPNKFEDAIAEGYRIYESNSLEDDKNDILIMNADKCNVDIARLEKEQTHTMIFAN